MSDQWRPAIGQRVAYLDGSGDPMTVVAVEDVEPGRVECRYWVWVRYDDGGESPWWAEDLVPVEPDA